VWWVLCQKLNYVTLTERTYVIQEACILLGFLSLPAVTRSCSVAFRLGLKMSLKLTYSVISQKKAAVTESW
jgi:hypothetical protein